VTAVTAGSCCLRFCTTLAAEQKESLMQYKTQMSLQEATCFAAPVCKLEACIRIMHTGSMQYAAGLSLAATLPPVIPGLQADALLHQEVHHVSTAPLHRCKHCVALVLSN
jgi:hypothetical protein